MFLRVWDKEVPLSHCPDPPERSISLGYANHGAAAPGRNALHPGMHRGGGARFEGAAPEPTAEQRREMQVRVSPNPDPNRNRNPNPNPDPNPNPNPNPNPIT